MAAALLALALVAGLAAGAPAWAQAPRVVAADSSVQAPPLAGEVSLSPREFAQLAAVRNPEVRYGRLGVDVAGHLSDAEAALYEAVLFASLKGTDSTRQRTVEERLSSAAFLSLLDERSSSAEAGVRQLLPSAGELSLSYRIVRRATNLISAAPKGHTLEQGDWSLLDPVKARPTMWRQTN